MTQTIQQLFDLTGKTALITAGAHGLGLQMAQALGEAGARIMLCDCLADELEAATAQLQAVGIDARWVAADCTLEADLQKLVSETLQRMGDVDILVNHADAAWAQSAQQHPAAAWDQAMNLHLRGYYLLSHLVGQHSMLDRRSGRIINIAPMAGPGGNPTAPATLACHTANGAVIGFTQALASAWGQYNITVNALCPGVFQSGMTAGTQARPGAARPTAALQRPCNGEDLKGSIVLLASEAGQHISGQCLAVDGGASLLPRQ
ncbi:MAG: SDR family NAD(P)-dependent oxidoreductase [Rhodoferax sp.]